MTNPKTTVLGYLAIVIAVGTYVQGFFTANPTWPPTLTEIMMFLGGLIGVFAKDGGH
jgi:hypothetical protein